MEENNKDIRDKYMEQHEYYMSLYQEKIKKLIKDTNKYYDIYNYGIEYYRTKMKDESYGSENYYKIKEKMDDLYNKHYALEKPNKILDYEANIYWELSQYYLDKNNKLMKYNPETRDFDDFYFTKKDTPLKTITKKKRKQLESEACSICLETHTYKNMMQLNCSHIFGKVCIRKLLRKAEEKDTAPKCPLCRTECCKKYSLFKMK
jgi:hypothetical protein